MAVPTILAEAPIGVAFPPISVPKASVQAKVSKLKPSEIDKLLITGTIVAAKGMLSTIAENKAESHKIIGIATARFPPEATPIVSATIFKTPVHSKPPTVTNKPMKKTRVRQSTLLTIWRALVVAANSVRKAATTPIKANESPVSAWVTIKITTSIKIALFILKRKRSTIASLGSGYRGSGGLGFEEVLIVSCLRKKKYINGTDMPMLAQAMGPVFFKKSINV